ncbi:putative protein phosphatase 2C 12 [Canna indica]|uniref:protein-serine/threonine phosphatase n=1 Tax=Canna indica TaxID=4628 RepID=A0AAQ3KJM4_9LILI|nr:putative protein phosphatase 2C 12 [Canna indica]
MTTSSQRATTQTRSTASLAAAAPCINCFNAIDQELMLKPELDCSVSGTTAVTIIQQAGTGKDLIIANLGDSRAVMGAKSEEGQLEAVQLTTDLKPSLPRETRSRFAS